MYVQAEYIWLDGATPTQGLRSKTRMLEIKDIQKISLSNFPEWGYDGSSTYQSSGDNSDLILKPVSFFKNPLSKEMGFLVMCEVYQENEVPHSSNTRMILRNILNKGAAKLESWFGYEQEYTLFDGSRPLGWPQDGFPGPQGPYYCGVGSDKIFGRDISEEHALACMKAGLKIYGTNAEVMPGQWEFQIGVRGFESDQVDALLTADELWIARWLLYRIAETYGVTVSFDNKPIAGDWNGAGCHTNFSTKEMRSAATGQKAIDDAISLLEKTHAEHISLYGAKLNERLTGLHETCSIETFRSGACDRGASIRIPQKVAEQGYGYLEDRRPGANCDPYIVAARLLATICKLRYPTEIETRTAQQKSA